MMAGPQKTVSYMFFSSEDKAMIREFFWKCLYTLKENKGLDLIHCVASNCCNCKTFITTFISLFLSIFVYILVSQAHLADIHIGMSFTCRSACFPVLLPFLTY